VQLALLALMELMEPLAQSELQVRSELQVLVQLARLALWVQPARPGH
jgi:hypothetical protein